MTPLARLNQHYWTNTKGTPAERLRKAIEAEALDPKEHGRDIATFIEGAGLRIPQDIPADLLDKISGSFAKAREDAARKESIEQGKAAIAANREHLDDYFRQLDRGVSPADPAMLEKGADILKALSFMAAAPARKGLTPDTMHDFGTGEGFAIKFWNGLKLPTPGCTLIGARTGAGKTSALVNVARELLEQGKRVAILSYEMNGQEIGLALTLSIMAKGRTEPVPGFDPKDDEAYPGERFNAPHDPENEGTDGDLLTDYFTNLKRHITLKGVPEYLAAATEKVKGFLVSGALDIHDGIGDADALSAYITGTDFDAYLVDYIQAITPGKDTPAEGYRRVGATVDKLRTIVNTGKKTIVAGAQFNRKEGAEAEREGFDPLPELFREAGDIEQLATLAIGIGWKPEKDGKKLFFWKVLKHRFNGAMRDARMVSGGHFRYFYNQPRGQWHNPQEWDRLYRSTKGTKGKAQEGPETGNTTGYDWNAPQKKKGK